MTRPLRTLIRLVLATLLAAGALAGASPAARADVPPGWQPGGLNSFEADFGDARWTHQGFYPGVAGNWHTGWVNVEEDDDVLTAQLIDWKCPAGAQPPAPLTWFPGQATACKVKRYQWVSVLDPWNIATFNQKRDRLRLQGSHPAVDHLDQPAGTVTFDLYLEAVGQPTVTSDTAGGTLWYEEAWSQARLFGTIDGHGLAGSGTTLHSGSVSFYVSGYVQG